MCSVILIATGHEENGHCNSKELIKIIDKIEPQVIFEEVSPSKFSLLYGGQLRDSLESYTIKMYLQKHSVNHYPVDLEMNDNIIVGFRREVKMMFDMLDSKNPECYDLMNLHAYNAAQLGFPYLNSQQCASLLEQRHLIEEKTLSENNNIALSETYRKWQNLIASRENEMLRNIYNYRLENTFERGLFLVGAEHRKPIIDKIPRFEEITKQKIDWVFNYL